MPGDSSQRSIVRRLAASVSFYTIALVVAGAVRLLAVPFIVHAISPSVYGTFATLWILMVMVHGVGDLGLGTAALRYAPECATPAARRSLFATMLSARAVTGLLLTLVILGFHEPLARWVTGSSGNGRALFWLAAVRPLAMVFEGLSDELRARDAMGTVSALIVLWATLTHGLSVLLVVGLGFELEGLVWGRALGEILACLAAAALCARFVIGRPQLSQLKQLLAFGWPLGAMYVLGTLRGLDRPLIRWLTSVDHVGAYELAMRFVGPIGLFNIALARVLEPFVYGRSQSKATPGFIDLFLRSYVAVFATVAMALSVIGPELIRIFSPEPYHGAIRALPALAFGAACEGLGRVAGVGADLAKQTRVWAIAGLLTLALGFPLAVALVPHFGIAGAGLAWVVANLASTSLAYAVARRVSGIVLPIERALVLVAIGTLLGTAAAWQPWPLLARLALLVGFGLAAWRVLGVRWSELRALV